MKWGEQIPAGFDLSSLRVLGSVGEPINPEAYLWYREHIGGGRTPVVDTWWQTETGAHMITPLPGVTAAKPGAAMAAFPGIGVDVVNDDGRPVGERGERLPGGDRSRGRRCCGRSGTTTSGTRRPTGPGSRARATTSPATAPSATTTAPSGSSAASTMS